MKHHEKNHFNNGSFQKKDDSIMSHFEKKVTLKKESLRTGSF